MILNKRYSLWGDHWDFVVKIAPRSFLNPMFALIFEFCGQVKSVLFGDFEIGLLYLEKRF